MPPRLTWWKSPGGNFCEFTEGFVPCEKGWIKMPDYDPVNHPRHYTSHPSGIECIQVTEWMGFNLGNAVKYIWRVGSKHDNATEDLHKAIWYLKREIAKRSAPRADGPSQPTKED